MDGYGLRLWLAVATALLGSLQFGYALGVLNTPLSFIATDLRFDVTTSGAVAVSALLVGAAVGSVVAGQIADALGPGRALLWNNTTLILGAILAASTPLGFWGLVAGRVFSGMGAGGASLYVPRYITEIAPTRIRGQLSSFNQVVATTGILLAYAVGWPYAKGGSHIISIGSVEFAWWRLMFAVGLIPAILQMGGLAVLPESPVWLRWVGRAQEAQAAEQQLLGARWQQEGEASSAAQPGRGDAEEPLLNGASSPQSGEDAPKEGGGWSALLRRRYRRIMVLAGGLLLLQQFSGINTVIYYSSEVFALAQLSNPIIGSVVMGVVQVAATLVAASLMDRGGRRPLLLISHAGMCVCLAVLSLAFVIPAPKAVQGNIAFGAVLAYVAAYSLGSGPIPWIYLPEILPDAVKGPAAAACTCLNWAANLAIGISFPLLLKALHITGAYLIFAVVNGLGVVFIWMLVIETKQRSLAEIAAELVVPD